MPTKPENARGRFERNHPRLYAARHVAKGAGQVLVAVLGVGLAIQFLPLPDISLPLPNLEPPSLPVPDVSLPGWARDVLASSKYWVPVLIGIGLALRELEKRNEASS